LGIKEWSHRRLMLTPELLARARREFAVAEGAAARRLDEVVESFACGYNSALTGAFDGATALPAALRGFAHEGAAMSLTLLDLMTASRGRRVRELVAATGDRYPHLIHVGAGWAFARLRLRPWTMLPGALGAPILRPLAWDGWGFHQAFFAPRRVLVQQRPGPRRGFCDQGAGRTLWFYAGADPDRITALIAAFPAVRRPDLWAGIGLAAAYTGAQPPSVLAALRERAGVANLPHLAQGAAFAATAHLRAAPPPPEVAAAVESLTGVPLPIAAHWTDTALLTALHPGASAPDAGGWGAGVWGAAVGDVGREAVRAAEGDPRGGEAGRYEVWRGLIRRAWEREQAGERVT
jgi:hypothetical protein